MVFRTAMPSKPIKTKRITKMMMRAIKALLSFSDISMEANKRKVSIISYPPRWCRSRLKDWLPAAGKSVPAAVDLASDKVVAESDLDKAAAAGVEIEQENPSAGKGVAVAGRPEDWAGHPVGLGQDNSFAGDRHSFERVGGSRH